MTAEPSTSYLSSSVCKLLFIVDLHGLPSMPPLRLCGYQGESFHQQLDILMPCLARRELEHLHAPRPQLVAAMG